MKTKVINRKAIQSTRSRIYNAIPFELLLRLSALLLLPFFSFLFRQSYRLAGFSYLRSDNLKTILMKPWVLAFLFVVAILYCLMILFESLVLFDLTENDTRKSPSILEALKRSVTRFRKLLARNSTLDSTLFLLCLPFLAALLSSPLWPGLSLPTFILDHIFSSPLLLSLLILAYLISSLIGLFMTRMLYLATHGTLTIREAGRKTFQDLKTNVAKLLLSLILWNLALAIITALVSTVVSFGLAAIVIKSLNRENWLVVFLALSRILRNTGVWILSAIAPCLIVTVLRQVLGQAPGHLDSTDSEKKIRGYKYKLSRTMIILILIALLVANEVITVYLDLNRGFIVNDFSVRTKITAHRASGGTSPENTTVALDEAIAALADEVELDAQITADYEVVVFHDSSLKRLLGVKQNLADTTWAELKNMPFIAQPDNESLRVPLLKDFLQKGAGRIRFNIELKPNSLGREELVSRVLNVVRESGQSDRITISSLDLESLRLVHQSGSKIRLGYILPLAKGQIDELKFIDIFSLEADQLNEALLADLQSRGREVQVWTVNDEARMEEFLRLGVNAVITDEPRMAHTMRAKQNAGGRLDLKVFGFLLPMVQDRIDVNSPFYQKYIAPVQSTEKSKP